MKGLRVEIVVRREGAPVEEAIAQPVEDVATVLARAGHESGGPRTPSRGPLRRSWATLRPRFRSSRPVSRGRDRQNAQNRFLRASGFWMGVVGSGAGVFRHSYPAKRQREGPGRGESFTGPPATCSAVSPHGTVQPPPRWSGGCSRSPARRGWQARLGRDGFCQPALTAPVWSFVPLDVRGRVGSPIALRSSLHSHGPGSPRRCADARASSRTGRVM